METKKFIHYGEDGFWVGWIENYSDYRTQGRTLDELKANLKEIHEKFSHGRLPFVRSRNVMAAEAIRDRVTHV